MHTMYTMYAIYTMYTLYTMLFHPFTQTGNSLLKSVAFNPTQHRSPVEFAKDVRSPRFYLELS